MRKWLLTPAFVRIQRSCFSTVVIPVPHPFFWPLAGGHFLLQGVQELSPFRGSTTQSSAGRLVSLTWAALLRFEGCQRIGEVPLSWHGSPRRARSHSPPAPEDPRWARPKAGSKCPDYPFLESGGSPMIPVWGEGCPLAEWIGRGCLFLASP